jgi:hypothetical protein
VSAAIADLAPAAQCRCAATAFKSTRGGRMHAIACRIERAAGRWQVVALHIG